MKVKDKAKELVEKYMDIDLTPYDEYGKFLKPEQAKQCALIAVDEILNILPKNEYLEDRGVYVKNREKKYFEEVKQEIEKI